MSKKVRWFTVFALGFSLVLAVSALANAASDQTLWGEEPHGEDFRLVISGPRGSGELNFLTIACALGNGTWLEGSLLKEGAFSLCLSNNQVFVGGIRLEAVLGNRLIDGVEPAVMVGIAEETHPATCLWAFIRYYPLVYDLDNWKLLTSSTWSAGLRVGGSLLGLVLGARDGFGDREWFARLEISPIKGTLLTFGYDGSSDLQVGCGLSL